VDETGFSVRGRRVVVVGAARSGIAAAELAAKSPVALALAKRLCNLSLGVDHAGSLEAEADSFGELFASEDAKEGLAAFVGKRAPTFVGR